MSFSSYDTLVRNVFISNHKVVIHLTNVSEMIHDTDAKWVIFQDGNIKY